MQKAPLLRNLLCKTTLQQQRLNQVHRPSLNKISKSVANLEAAARVDNNNYVAAKCEADITQEAKWMTKNLNHVKSR